MYVYMYVCMYVCMYALRNVCMYVRNVCMYYVNTYICVHVVYKHICSFSRIFVYICVWIKHIAHTVHVFKD